MGARSVRYSSSRVNLRCVSIVSRFASGGITYTRFGSSATVEVTCWTGMREHCCSNSGRTLVLGREVHDDHAGESRIGRHGGKQLLQRCQTPGGCANTYDMAPPLAASVDWHHVGIVIDHVQRSSHAFLI